ncbi:hypothetical protein ASPBRDRAFT_129917 [Aspergillus brasiliensis CBS 101740]|uniref:Isopropylmalate dehydrogenase-like domain-containing protein n=1 Tax=Aspergillus brasiliensis (strain CBS 101740 / IMI 381727 / IBT 21946) TaxID=767769 RepID=A0A1L9UEK5_ASPBC|nr:hypothetical protein ASPBRDRAFT_129917 [Aspergillus brasiliensis CBS 101740]
MGDTLLVGLATGNGTGPELMGVFEAVLQSLGTASNLTIRFLRSDRIYHSYSSLLAINETDAVTSETLADAAHYRQFCEKAASQGVSGIFRTSVSAQALYLVREQLEAVKIEHFRVSPSASIILVRDQAQGFYSGTNILSPTKDAVYRTACFSKDVFSRIVTFALRRARTLLPTADDNIEAITLVYKFHLFDGLFHTWAQEWQSVHGILIRFVQGDTMNRDLLAFGVQGHQLLIAANEYADLMQTMFLDRFGLGVQETTYAENVYLHPTVQGLVEYQTAHGSADDLTGKGIVNPTATIRAAAALLEDQASCHGMKMRVDDALQQMRVKGIATPDQGGWSTTTSFVEIFLQAMSGGIPVAAGDSCESTAVVVVDLQNDFVTQYKDTGVMERVTANVSRVVDVARRSQVEVIFVRFLGDDKFQGPSWRQRNLRQNRQSWSIEGTWGAEIFGSVKVQPGERVFDKKAQFDPFLSNGFEKYVVGRKLDRLVVVGLYADVCVDATVRGAFQRGLRTTVVRQCTAGFHFTADQMLDYMQEIYGSDVVALEDLSLG